MLLWFRQCSIIYNNLLYFSHSFTCSCYLLFLLTFILLTFLSSIFLFLFHQINFWKRWLDFFFSLRFFLTLFLYPYAFVFLTRWLSSFILFLPFFLLSVIFFLYLLLKIIYIIYTPDFIAISKNVKSWYLQIFAFRKWLTFFLLIFPTINISKYCVL